MTMTKSTKFKLMMTALKRIGCDVLRIQDSHITGDHLLAAYTYGRNQVYRLFADIDGNRYALGLRGTLGIQKDDFSRGHTWEDGIVAPDDYWLVFDRLIRLKKRICTANGMVMLTGEEDEIYKLEIESDLQGR